MKNIIMNKGKNMNKSKLKMFFLLVTVMSTENVHAMEMPEEDMKSPAYLRMVARSCKDINDERLYLDMADDIEEQQKKQQQQQQQQNQNVNNNGWLKWASNLVYEHKDTLMDLGSKAAKYAVDSYNSYDSSNDMNDAKYPSGANFLQESNRQFNPNNEPIQGVIINMIATDLLNKKNKK